jgi:predicted Zn-dependent protease
LLLGRASLDLGKPEQALEHLEWITRAVPSLRLAQVDLAAALGAVGRYDEGARRYLSQHARSVDPIARDPAIPRLFRAWQAADPRPERRLVAAKILHAYGYLREALEMLAALEAEAASEQGPGLRAAGPSRLSRDVLRETAAIRRALSSAPNGS